MPAVAVGIELVLIDFAAQRIAVNAQNFSRAGLVTIGAVQNAFDKAFLEFADRFVKKNSPLHHLTDKAFQLVFHDSTLRS